MDITQIKHSGFTWNIRVPTPWLDINILTEVVSKDEYGLRQLRDVGPDCIKTILDIGGHIGSFGVFAKSLWPRAKLIAVEPHPDNCELYRKNLKVNGLQYDSHVIQAAVSYDPECNCLINSPSTTGGYVMRTKKEGERYVAEGYRFYNRILDDDVVTITVEDIIEKFNIKQFDLAKWDCEGGEVDAFKNITSEAASKFRIMVGEYHIWDEHCRYLKPDIVDCIKFWEQTRRRFPHLDFIYKNKAMGLFQAWPKGAA